MELRLKNILFALTALFLHYSFLWSQLSVSVDTTTNYVCTGQPCDYDGPGILINEIMVSPENGDGSISGPGPFGATSGRAEWIELHNPNYCEPVDISCYLLGNYTFEGDGGFVIPNGTVVPPGGFVLIRGASAQQVPIEKLEENGGNVIEVVVPSNIDSDGVCSSGTRVWFPNYGGWFAFYDADGVPQDAVRWGPGNESDLYEAPCVAFKQNCPPPDSLLSYDKIPDDRKTYASTKDAGEHKDKSIRRIPDGGDWDSYGEPTFADCNADCFTNDNAVCNGTATANVTGGTPPYSYQWDDAEQQTTATAERLCAGTYTLTVTDSQGQTQTVEVIIEDHVPTVSNSIDEVLCENDPPFLLNDMVYPEPINNGNTAFFEGNGVTGTTFDPFAASYGEHIIDYTYRTKGGCENNAEGLVKVKKTPILEVLGTKDTYCLYENVNFDLSPEGGTLSGPGVNSDSSLFIADEAGPGIHELTYTYTAENGCSNQLKFSVEVLDQTRLSLDVPSDLCVNDSSVTILFSPEDAVTKVNGEEQTVINVTDLGVGTHTVSLEYTAANECENEIIETIEIHPLPEVEFESDFFASCPPLQVGFNASSSEAIACEWDFGDGNTSNECDSVAHYFTETGVFDITYSVTSPKNCKNATTIEGTIEIYTVPKVNFGHNPDPINMLNTEVDFINLTEDGVAYEWFIEDGFPDYSTEKHPISLFPEDQPGTYHVKLVSVSKDGCYDSITKQVKIESVVNLYIPNSFTPNGDHTNDTWGVSIEGHDPDDYQLEVYNRWGELIWQTKNPHEHWDGTCHGKKVKTGTYVWKLTTREKFTGINRRWHGHLNVLD